MAVALVPDSAVVAAIQVMEVVMVAAGEFLVISEVMLKVMGWSVEVLYKLDVANNSYSYSSCVIFSTKKDSMSMYPLSLRRYF